MDTQGTRTLLLVAALLSGLVGSSPAHGANHTLAPDQLNGVIGAYMRVAERNALPAPLVPTWIPPVARSEFLSTDMLVGRESRDGVSRLRFGWQLRSNPTIFRGVVTFHRGQYRTLRALRDGYRIFGFGPPRATRVRGKPALLFRKPPPLAAQTALVWMEAGLVHEIAAGQPRWTPLPRLRRMAEALEPISPLFGGSTDQTAPHVVSAIGFSTPGTVSLSMDLAGPCVDTTNTPISAGLGGGAVVLLAPRSGPTVSTTTQSVPGSHNLPPWNVNLTASVAPESIKLDLRALFSAPPAPGNVAFPSGGTCDTGAQSFTLTPIAPLP